MNMYDFTNEQEYKDFEKFITQKFKEIPQLETSGSEVFLPWCNNDDDFVVLKPRNYIDMDIIQLYCFIITGVVLTGCDDKVPIFHNNEIIIINFFDGDYCKCFIKDDLINNINKLYSDFEKQLEKMVKED